MFDTPSVGVRRESLIGIIAIALPLYLLLSNPIFNSGMTASSISAHFYSDKRDMFVFALILIGIFQLRYHGMTYIDRFLSVVGAISAVCIGLFPTPPASPTTQDTIIGMVHLASATMLFGIQAYWCFIFFSRRSLYKSRLRSAFYLFFGVIILGSMIAIVIVKLLGVTDARWKPVFWFEALALFAFGWSWLISILHRHVNPFFAGEAVA